jgi:S-adenosylhomocysteine hydrolase
MEGLSANYYVLTRVNRYQTLHSYFQGIMGTVDMLLAGAPSINLRLIAT